MPDRDQKCRVVLGLAQDATFGRDGLVLSSVSGFSALNLEVHAHALRNGYHVTIPDWETVLPP